MNIELGPALSNIGSIAGIGPAIGPVSLPINEGPVSFADFKNTMPLQIGPANPIQEIKFNAPAEARTIASVESFLAQARIEEQVAIKPQPVRQVQAMYRFVDVPKPEQVVKPAEVIMPQTEPLVMPKLDLLPQADVFVGLEYATRIDQASNVQAISRSVFEIVPSAAAQSALQESADEEQTVIENIINEQIVIEEEEVNKVVKRHVVDDHALRQVIVELKGAVAKARELAKKLGIKITGELIGKFVLGQHPGNESEAVKGKGPDGSIPERQQSIAELGEFSSEIQAERAVVKVGYEKPPVKIRVEGEPVKDEDVNRVYRHHRIKPKAVIEVITRVIKKKKLVAPSGQKPVEVLTQNQGLEHKVEDYPQLAEVFPKAA